VPAYFKKQPQLVLQVGLNMAIQIPDLKVDDEGVTCTLSFNRARFGAAFRGRPSTLWSARPSRAKT